MRDALAPFHEPVRAWFRDALGAPTRAQREGWPSIAKGASTLLLAPTGSGKTLAAFLGALDRLMWTPEPTPQARCRVLYVSPLKALAYDVERNLRAPLVGIAAAAESAGQAVRIPIVELRSGDTSPAARARMKRTPPDILVTTPESLFLLLTSGSAAVLASVETVIIDEIHALVPTKRGAHLALSLERLEQLRPPGAPKLQRIGLSATQRPTDEAARFLCGFDEGRPRPVSIVDVSAPKTLELSVAAPEIDMGRLGEIDPIPSGSAASGGRPRSIWPALHERIVSLVETHRSTIVFVNSRRLAERLATALNDLSGRELALAHHGSIAREKRLLIEDRLKAGEIPAIVATSSLELGIDMGAVDLVIQVEAPPSVASGLQRVGRASHGVGGLPRGVILPKHRADLLAATAIAERMRRAEVEPTRHLQNPIDVLAQQIVAICAMDQVSTTWLYEFVRRAAPFAELPRSAFEGVLDMLSGHFDSTDYAELKPRLVWDRTTGELRARQGARALAVANAGTIPDRGLYGVFLAGDETSGGKRVGELDEEMVYELREGEVFLLGATSWRAEEITRDRVLVTPAPGEPAKMPFWHGDRASRALADGLAIGALTRAVAKKSADEAATWLAEEHHLDVSAANNLVRYVHEQREATAEVPSDRSFLLERWIDDVGDLRVALLAPLGARVLVPWATAVRGRLEQIFPGAIDAIASDDGIVFRLPASDSPIQMDVFTPDPGDVEQLLLAALPATSLFAARFRECASRALLLPRRRPGKRTPLWAQRKRSTDLLAAASRHPSFPILLETYRECLRDVFDLPGLVDVLGRVRSRAIRVTTVDSAVPSPFAASLTFSFVGNFIYDGDAPLAERRAQALTLDHARLRELLGEAELRSLLDPEVIEAHERALQRLDRPARDADGVHDLLLWLGDLTREEVTVRASPSGESNTWVEALLRERRIVQVRVAGELRLVAVEDVGRLRDAAGVVPPLGLPDALLRPVADPMGDLLRRYARTHGPFQPADAARRWGLGAAAFDEVARRLVREASLVEGAFRSGIDGSELCDAEVLRTLRGRSLAALRREVEPVSGEAWSRLVLAVQGVGEARRGDEALLNAIESIEGVALPFSELESAILPARVEGFDRRDLDALMSAGLVVWAGAEALGPYDGRIRLYLTEHETLLAPPPNQVAGPMAARIREVLATRGAAFFTDIVRSIRGFPSEVVEALGAMVWAGEVTNDTLEPLRSQARQSTRRSDRSRPNRNALATRGIVAGTEGRWSLRSSRWGEPPDPTTKRAALARALLSRTGVVTRDSVARDEIDGGFSALYPVLRAMEESGRVRRGYFVEGRGGAQFAFPGAEDRLRGLRDDPDKPAALMLAATDPAQVFGAGLPWPTIREGARPQRTAGARVILVGGALRAYVARGGTSLETFLPAHEPAHGAAAAAIASLLASEVDQGRRKTRVVATIDGLPAASHSLADVLRRAGFEATGDGLVRRVARAWSPRGRRSTMPERHLHDDLEASLDNNEDDDRDEALT